MCSYLCQCICVLLTISQQYHVTSGDFYKRFKLRIPGDIMIGALFPIHEQPTVKADFSRQCGKIREQYGIHRIELMLLALKDINDNPNLLPGIKLGLDARDTCWHASIALEECMDFIRTAFAYKEHEECLEKVGNANKSICEPFERLGQISFEKPIAAVIGPGSSGMTKTVQQVLQLFSIPEIGYSATAAELSNSIEYPYFIRLVPSDAKQVEVIISILKYFGWNYVALLNSKGFYGDKGIALLKKRMQSETLCAETELSIDNKQTVDEFMNVAKELFNLENKARVVICFCQGETVAGLLVAMHALGLVGQGYIIIGSDGWADRPDILGPLLNQKSDRRLYSDVAQGSLTIRIHSPKIPEFDDYFMNLTPERNTLNPWFQEFWENKFDCLIPTANKLRNKKYCSGNETLKSPLFKQDNKLWLLNISIYTVALALHQVHSLICGPNSVGICDDFLHVDGDMLWQELVQIQISDRNGDLVYFDENGDPPGNYEILNYQKTIDVDGQEKYGYIQIGQWIDKNFKIHPELIQWPITSTKTENNSNISISNSPIRSYCSESCSPWERKVVNDEFIECCWVCMACKPNELKFNTTTCVACELGFKPNQNKTECEKILPNYPDWFECLPLISLFFASFGAVFTIFVFIVFICNHNTSIVKASTRELMYVILIGMLMAHSTIFLTIPRSSVCTCVLSRVLPGLSFSMMYGALVTKTNRIARIMEGSKRIHLGKQKCLSANSQLLLIALINTIEAVIIITMLFIQPAGIKLTFSDDLVEARQSCNTTQKGTMIPLLFGAFLIIVSTIYAIQTRNIPHNFNEAKFIGFTMYTTCVLWLAIVPVFLAGYETQFTLVLAVSLSATILIVILFMPKIYIILCQPERNSRTSFTTIKDIRCHIGAMQTNMKISPKNKKINPDSDVDSTIKTLVGKYENGIENCIKLQNSTKENSKKHKVCSNTNKYRGDDQWKSENSRQLLARRKCNDPNYFGWKDKECKENRTDSNPCLPIQLKILKCDAAVQTTWTLRPSDDSRKLHSLKQ